MSLPLALSATYSDLKFIKSRKVCQITLELPIEAAPGFVEMFGTPNPAEEVWVAIARLAKPVEGKPERDTSLAQEAGRLCDDPLFQKWIGVDTAEEAAQTVRDICGVNSRSEINPRAHSGYEWRRFKQQFYDWRNEPSKIGERA